LLLGAEFVAWVQILIYVGAIVILFLFGLMLTKAPIGRDMLDNQNRWIGGIVGAGVFLGLVFLIQDAFRVQDSVAETTFRTTTADVGVSLFRDYVLPFEAVSFLLLAALIGAVVLARKDAEAK
jgi:NADH-quinone oxidoreductase subunit J